MNEAKKIDKPQSIDSFITDVEKLTNDILKYFPKFFDDFTNFEYGTGVDAGNDFKKIYNKAKKLNKAVSEKYQLAVIKSVCECGNCFMIYINQNGEKTCFNCLKPISQTVL